MQTARTCRHDETLAGNEEPPLGAHLVTPRFAYSHHGIYVGGGTVVHYAFAKHWRRGPVEEISFTRFADGHPVRVRPARPNGLQGAEVVRRARSRLGEDRYRVFTNNCEHLSEWCVNGVHRSPQVERCLARVRTVSAVSATLCDCCGLRPFSATASEEREYKFMWAHEPPALLRARSKEYPGTLDAD